MWKFGGNFSLACGSLSAAVAIGGGATGAISATAGLSGRPCAQVGGAAGGWAAGAGAGVDGAAGACAAGAGAAPGPAPDGDCWATTGHAAAASPAVNAASNRVRGRDGMVLMALLPAVSLATRCARSVGRKDE